MSGGERGRVTPAQVEFIVERYLAENGYEATLESFRRESSENDILKSSGGRSRGRNWEKPPKGLLGLAQILQEYVDLKGQRIRFEREKKRIHELVRGIDRAVRGSYQSPLLGGGPVLGSVSTVCTPISQMVSGRMLKVEKSHQLSQACPSRTMGPESSLATQTSDDGRRHGHPAGRYLPVNSASPESQRREASTNVSYVAKNLFTKPPESSPLQGQTESQRVRLDYNGATGQPQLVGDEPGNEELDFSSLSHLYSDLSSSDLLFLNNVLANDDLAQPPQMEVAESSQKFDQEGAAWQKGSSNSGNTEGDTLLTAGSGHSGAVTATRGVTKRIKLSSPSDLSSN